MGFQRKPKPSFAEKPPAFTPSLGERPRKTTPPRTGDAEVRLPPNHTPNPDPNTDLNTAPDSCIAPLHQWLQRPSSFPPSLSLSLLLQ